MVTHPVAVLGVEQTALATVIPLIGVAHRRFLSEGATAARAVEVLERRYGSSWRALPETVGRAAARAEELMVAGPLDVQIDSGTPEQVVHAIGRLLAGARATVELTREEAEVLGEALEADLLACPMVTQLEVASAVMELAAAPRAATCWAWPRQADAAEVVLQATSADLRTAARLHQEMYELYTDDVWDVPDAVLQPRRGWSLPTRWRLRRGLAAASRTGRVPGRMSLAADAIARTRSARRRVASIATLLSRHLGELDRGPLTDADAALDALGSVRRLQRALGDQLDPGRLARLILADAFTSPDLVGPAARLRTTLTAWARQVAVEGGHGALDMRVAELDGWADRLDQDLPALAMGVAALAHLPVAPRDVRELVNHLLARQHIHEVAVRQAALRSPGLEHAGSRSRS